MKNFTLFFIAVFLTVFGLCGQNSFSSTGKPHGNEALLMSPLTGSYTINSNLATDGTNFNSFTDFANAINTYGLIGEVSVGVVTGSGPYTEQVLFGQFPNSSSENTLYINGNGETLQYLSTNSNERATLKFDGTN